MSFPSETNSLYSLRIGTEGSGWTLPTLPQFVTLGPQLLSAINLYCFEVELHSCGFPGEKVRHIPIINFSSDRMLTNGW